jgi:signal transduction histidine kinase
VLATLGAVAVAIPAYRGFQDAVDRRFNRRRHDAIRRVQGFVRDPDPATSVEDVLRSALEDPSLSVAYWVGDRDEWVCLDGRAMQPSDDQIDVRRQGRPVARIAYDNGSVDAELAEAVCREATPELENAMLRARITLQLAEVRESRARIATAHVTERRRLERNLHDGSQQRLLALALELRAAQVNGTTQRLEQGVAAAIEELQTAVLELRELANGLNPAVLQSQGLPDAIEDLASRFPVEVELHGLAGRRFPEEIEAAAWFIACEGVTNAVKHASATHIGVDLSAENGTLTVRVTDDGVGHADPGGRGLRGLADRTEAAGGRLTVESTDGRTTLTGELPCGS